MSKETFDSLGNQKQTNYALNKSLSKKEFIKELLDGILPSPSYFPINAQMNSIKQARSIDQIISSGTKPLSLKDLDREVGQGALILDVRSQKEFSEGHIPNSWFIGIDGGFAPWAGSLIKDLNQKILIICPKKREEEVVKRLARVGFDNTCGYLSGSFETWKRSGRPQEKVLNEEAKNIEDLFGTIEIVDVRKPGEFKSEHLHGAQNHPLDFLSQKVGGLDKNKPYHVHCAGGYRSVIFISILKSKGYHKLIDIKGGYESIRTTSIPKINYFSTSES
jgi:rhodanese-related sulfurtransferase